MAKAVAAARGGDSAVDGRQGSGLRAHLEALAISEAAAVPARS